MHDSIVDFDGARVLIRRQSGVKRVSRGSFRVEPVQIDVDPFHLETRAARGCMCVCVWVGGLALGCLVSGCAREGDARPPTHPSSQRVPRYPRLFIACSLAVCFVRACSLGYVLWPPPGSEQFLADRLTSLTPHHEIALLVLSSRSQASRSALGYQLLYTTLRRSSAITKGTGRGAAKHAMR